MTTIAIDFGTSNTVITRWNNTSQKAEIISLVNLSEQLLNNPPLVPSLLYVENALSGKTLAGQEVKDRGLDISNNPRFFRNFKRGIGTKIKGFIPELDGETVNLEKAGEWFLSKVIYAYKSQYREPIDSLILTVPVDSFESYRNWLTEACQSWEIDKIQLLDESTAVALGYGTVNEDIVLVVDFGGGTIDLSLVQLNLGSNSAKTPQGFILKWGHKMMGENSKQKVKTAKVLGKVGQNLGGSDIDNWLVDYFAKTLNFPKSSLMTRLAERVKIELSSQNSASEVYFDDQSFETYELELDRQQFHAILEEHGFLSQLDHLMNQLLQQGRRNGIDKTDISGVLLVGGSVQIPAVKTWIEGYFPKEKIKFDRPFTAIAEGALQLNQTYEVQDFLYHSYGIRYWNRRENRHSWHTIIPEGQPYPFTQPVELILGASVDQQPSIELIIGELGSETSRTEVYFEGDRLLTRSLTQGQVSVQPLNDTPEGKTIAKLDPLGLAGVDRIKVLFIVNVDRTLRITVEDLLTQETLLENQSVAQLS